MTEPINTLLVWIAVTLVVAQAAFIVGLVWFRRSLGAYTEIIRSGCEQNMAVAETNADLVSRLAVVGEKLQVVHDLTALRSASLVRVQSLPFSSPKERSA